jgi:hypothetical protein
MIGNLFESSSSASSEEKEAILFKFKVKDKVLLARKASYSEKITAFDKPSVHGSYGRKVYTVVDCKMKHNKYNYFVPMYKLNGLEGWYYERELTLANDFPA